jgi:hypothetical protein
MFSVVASIVIFGSGGAISAREIAQLRVSTDAAEAQWTNATPERFSYILRSGGVFGYTEYRIQVDGPRCVARSRFVMGKPQTQWRSDTCEGRTIAALFGVVRDQLSRPQQRVELKLDSSYGFPAYASFDPITDLTDTSTYFIVEAFKGKQAPNKSLERTRER